MYLLDYIPKDNRVYLGDKDGVKLLGYIWTTFCHLCCRVMYLLFTSVMRKELTYWATFCRVCCRLIYLLDYIMIPKDNRVYFGHEEGVGSYWATFGLHFAMFVAG